MATFGIGRPVVPNEDGARTLEKMLLKDRKLEEANRELVMHRASRNDFTTIRTLPNRDNVMRQCEMSDGV